MAKCNANYRRAECCITCRYRRTREGSIPGILVRFCKKHPDFIIGEDMVCDLYKGELPNG